MSAASPLTRATFDAVLDVLRSDPAARDEIAAVLAPHLWKHLEAQANTPRDDGWLNSKRAASYIGLTINALHKHTAARTIPFEQVQPFGKLWFRRSELDAWRHGARTDTQASPAGGPRRSARHAPETTRSPPRPGRASTRGQAPSAQAGSVATAH